MTRRMTPPRAYRPPQKGIPPHTSYPRIRQPISDEDFIMLKRLEKKFPYLTGRPSNTEMEEISREKLKDVAKMRRRARDYEHPEEVPVHWSRRGIEPRYGYRHIALLGGMLAAQAIMLYLGRREAWITEPSRLLPFDSNPTTLLWDTFQIAADVPPIYEVVHKHPSIEIEILPAGGLNYTQCLRIHWPKWHNDAWRGVILRWHHLLPLRNFVFYGFLHRAGYENGPWAFEATANYTIANSLVRSGFYASRADLIWPIWLRSWPSNIHHSLPLEYGVVPGHYATCAWTIALVESQYVSMIVNNHALPVMGSPIRMYGKEELVLPFLEIEAWHPHAEACDYYLDNITVMSFGPVLPGLNEELAQRTTTWPIKDILFDPTFHPA